jgi:hypothetical protein
MGIITCTGARKITEFDIERSVEVDRGFVLAVFVELAFYFIRAILSDKLREFENSQRNFTNRLDTLGLRSPISTESPSLDQRLRVSSPREPGVRAGTRRCSLIQAELCITYKFEIFIILLPLGNKKKEATIFLTVAAMFLSNKAGL